MATTDLPTVTSFECAGLFRLRSSNPDLLPGDVVRLGVEEPVDVCREIKVVLKQKAMAGVAIDFNGCVRNKRAEQIGKAWWDHQICVAVSREGRLLYRSKTEELADGNDTPRILCVAGLDGAQHVALIFALQKPVEELHALRLAAFGVLEEDVEQLRAADVGLTRGIGENAAPVRAAICAKLGWLGAKLDEAANLRNGPCISTDNSTVSVFVIPTNEELMIAQHTLAISKA